MISIYTKCLKCKSIKTLITGKSLFTLLQFSTTLFTTYIASKALEEYQTKNIMEKVKLQNDLNEIKRQNDIAKQNYEYYSKNIEINNNKIPWFLKSYIKFTIQIPPQSPSPYPNS